MRVIVGGAGRVGTGIVAHLVEENANVTVIDREAKLIENVMHQYDVKGVVGHCAYPEILREAGAEDADMIIAVTFSDETNMVACQIAYFLFSVERTIARIRAQDYLQDDYGDLFVSKNIPIKSVISPEVEVGRSILNRVGSPGTKSSVSYARGEVKVAELLLDSSCPLLHTPLRQLNELFPALPATVVAVKREASLFLPKGDDQLYPGDEVTIATPSHALEDILSVLKIDRPTVRNLILVGGGSIGQHVVKSLEQERNIRCRIIEADRKQAELTADRLRRSIVIHGDGLDRDILREAGAENAEMVIGVTNDDRVNVLATAMARKLGCKRSIALVNDQNLSILQDNLQVDVFVDPRVITLSTILRELRRGKITEVNMVGGGGGEVWEFEILKTSPLNGLSINDKAIPDGARIGAIMRGGSFIRPSPDLHLEEGDVIILFLLKEALGKVEKLIRVRPDFF